MEKRKPMLSLIAEAVDAPQELLPGTPLIEITGSQRVLIENHCGITEYERELIRVKLPFGEVILRGSSMKITRMMKSKLVIVGNLSGLELERRGKG